MQVFNFSSVKVSAVLVSIAANAVLFTALAAGFGGASEPELAVLQLPTVTVYGKRLADEPASVSVAKTPAAVTSVNDIKL
jgi:hypothetical protein